MLAVPRSRPPLALAAALVIGCAASPPAAEHPAPSPDERFWGAGPCPDAPPGVELHETADFTPGGSPAPLLVLMGGGAEVDEAGARFAEAAAGGDVLVLRASGSTTSYTSWFADELPLAVPAAAVGTVLVEDPAAGDDDAVLCRVARADALWLAGGDQRDYLLRWPADLHEAMARAVTRGVALGGTSAGAMSLGALAFDAALGSIDAPAALAAPLGDDMSLSPSPFAAPTLDGWLVDTHFSERGRLGRLVAFAARAAHDGNPVLGLGIDEETAVVIDGATVAVQGAGEAWLVALDEVLELDDGAALDARAHVAPLSRQSAWPPQAGSGAPNARAVVVTDGALHDDG